MNQRPDWAKNQHYVPKFLLKNFADGEEQIHVFDKQERKEFRTNVRNVAAENGLYDIKMPDGSITTGEKNLSNLETAARESLNKLVTQQTLASLTPADRVTLALFAAVQMLRVKQQILILTQMTEIFGRRFGTVEGLPQTEKERTEDARKVMIQSLADAPGFLPDFLNKTWLLVKAARQSKFYISDNPIAMYNKIRNPHRATRGLRVRGIEIHMPVSSELSLAFYCRTHEEGWRKTKAEAEICQALGHSLPAEFANQARLLDNIVHSLSSGDVIELSETATNFQNERQIANSSRFVFSKDGDFRLAKEALEQVPEWRKGPQLAGSKPK
ncbi:MAG: DUF4238 domain-containing protein [Verrucomicrobia bacterium]|nr:DUF4238 domain-containing protein [Verrucomicrobiota bacterium]